MKTFYFFAVIIFFIFYFSNPALGQEIKKDKKIISYDPEIGDWDIVIPIPEGVKPNEDFNPFIVVNNFWKIPAEFTEKGIELIHPSELFLWSGQDYFFKAIFVNEYFNIQESPPITLYAPEILLEISYSFKEENLQIETEFSEKENNFSFSEDESYFRLIDNDTDSIIYGKGEIIPIEKISGNKISGNKKITKNNKTKFLTCSVGFENEFGEVKLYASEIKSLFLKKDDKGFIVKNVFGVGAIVPYWNDGEMRTGYIYDMNGNCVKQLKVLSGEACWFDIPIGVYVFVVEGIGSQKVIKAFR